eukprot:gene11691-12756_t
MSVEMGHLKVPIGPAEEKSDQHEDFPRKDPPALPSTTPLNPDEPAIGVSPTSENARIPELKKVLKTIIESNAWSAMMAIVTIWTLFQTDIKYSSTTKDADLGFEVVISIFFFLFIIEIIAQCIYKEDYFNIPTWAAEPGETLYQTWQRRLSIGSFYFWMDVIATGTLVLDMKWIIGQAGINSINGGGDQSAQGSSAAKTGARLGRLIRLVRMVRLTRLAKLYKYAMAAIQGKEIEKEDAESRVGAAMAELTNRRVLILILLMLIIIPLLNINDPDVSLSLGVQLVHKLAQLNASDPTTYQSGLILACSTVIDQLPVVSIIFNDNYNYFLDQSLISDLRPDEQLTYYYNTNGTSTSITYDQRSNSINSALFSIYTTLFIIVILIGGIYSFTLDVQNLVITPIEKLVALVKKIAQNPLGVEYKMMGEDEGFKDGMETTVLLTTITKIGGLMRVGFGEAGAAIIAKNLQESTNGKLNLLGSGTLIYSIFGFCDVRQFTDTTECLQEEVMLFVNRIAHILHSIVVQCSGAANKNIGDAFLLTWKIDEKATKEQKALLADQALLTFCKALIELARHQEFICNFSVAATGRLFKRFPDYKVRIGSGLHVGWAIEGAIGSNRKIDASYISPHVSTTEFLESSTKEYGVSLLMSEPFYRLLSPAASRFVRQVDRIRRSPEEGPMGLYTYDSDLSIDWNDPFRKKTISKADNSTSGAAVGGGGTLKARLQNVVRRTTIMTAVERTQLLNASLAPISEHSGSFSISTVNAPVRRKSRDSSGDFKRESRRRSVLAPMVSALEEVDEENADEAEAAAQNRLEQAKQTPIIKLSPYNQNIWVEDQDLIDLRHRVNDSFRSIWAEAMDAFIRGDWTFAKEKFQETLRLSKKRDVPSKRMLEYLKEHQDNAPDDWNGYCDHSGAGGH